MAKQSAEKKPAPKAEAPEDNGTESQTELKVVPKAEPVTMHRMMLEDEINTRFRITVKQGVTPDQILDEGFWCHLSGRMIPGDTLIVRPDDSTWEAVLHVVNCGPQFAHVLQKQFYDLAPMDHRTHLPSIYKVEYAGPIHKWRFLREGKMMRDGFASEQLANRAASQHQMAVNRAIAK